MTACGTPALEFVARLRRREAELRDLLERAGHAAGDTQDVIDFKDIAAQDARAVIDDAAHAHAASELRQVVAALRRVDAGTYGVCESCGEAIDERRLRALPSTPTCTACQLDLERVAAER